MMPSSLLHPGFGLAGWYDMADQKPWQNVFPKGSDSFWMAEALCEAMKGYPMASPNPAVGCIIVKDGIELSRGVTEPFGGLHGETKALSNMNRDLAKDATLYVTLEPCTHHGKQPPCIDAILPLGLKRLVIAMKDPNPVIESSGIDALRRSGVQVQIGILEAEAKAFYLCFTHQIATGRTPLILKWAQSIDGALADHTGKSQWISSEESRLYTHYLRLKYDAIMVGAQTAAKDLPSLLSRHPLATPENQPLRLVFDPKGLLSGTNLKVNQPAILDKTFCSEARSILLTTKDRNSFTDLVEEKGHLVLTLDDHDPFNFEAVLGLPACKKFLKKPLGSIMVEGGSSLLSNLIHRDNVVGGHTFLSPLFLGGSHWIGKGLPQPLKESSFMDLKQTRVFGRDVLFEWSKPFKRTV